LRHPPAEAGRFPALPDPQKRFPDMSILSEHTFLFKRIVSERKRARFRAHPPALSFFFFHM